MLFGGLLGRWRVGFARFEFVIDGHKEMESPETLFESRLGVAFHYIFGGGGVALVYPTWFAYTDFTFPQTEFIICPKDHCHCGTDICITKMNEEKYNV